MSFAQPSAFKTLPNVRLNWTRMASSKAVSQREIQSAQMEAANLLQPVLELHPSVLALQGITMGSMMFLVNLIFLVVGLKYVKI
jgi:hypothetical protein